MVAARGIGSEYLMTTELQLEIDEKFCGWMIVA